MSHTNLTRPRSNANFIPFDDEDELDYEDPDDLYDSGIDSELSDEEHEVEAEIKEAKVVPTARVLKW
jgi:hypothetical protein